MKQLSWQTITVQQFLDIYRLSLNTELDEMDKLDRVICILYDKTEQQMDEILVPEYKRMASEVQFVMSGEVPGKPVKQIRIGKKRYSIIYDPSKLKHRQYVELLHFGDKPVDNMHLVMASIVQPVNWWGKRLANKAEDHESIAADMLQAPVIHVYHSCVFFCKLYVSLIQNIKGSLVQQMMKAGTSRVKAERLIAASISAMAGFIPQKNWQPLKV